MKQKTYIFGVITAIIVFTGLVFKINHWAGAGIMLTIGIIIFLLFFLPVALIDNYKAEGNSRNLLLYITTWLTCFIVFMAMLFKIQHWALTQLLVIIAIPFPFLVFLPVFMIVTSRNKNFSIYNTVFVLILLVVNSVFSVLLALNVSKNRIDDSLKLSGNFYSLEKVLSNLPDQAPGNALVNKIDDVIGTVNEYREIILKQEKMSLDQWNKDPGSLLSPDARRVAFYALFNAGGSLTISKLHNNLRDLVSEMEDTPGYEELAKAAPVIFDLNVPSGNELDWSSWKFNDNNLAWVLIYLDGLETNLKMIRATIK